MTGRRPVSDRIQEARFMADPQPDRTRDAPREIGVEDVRSGRTRHITRYVLGISLGLAILAMVIVYLFVLA